MKPLQSLTQHLNRWRRVAMSKNGSPDNLVANPSSNMNHHNLGVHQPLRSCLLKELSSCLPKANPPQTQPGRSHRYTAYRYPVTLVVALVSLTSTMGHHFYNQPKLDVNTVAPQTIRAPQDARVEDKKTTEAKRKAVRRGLVPVLMVDPEVNQQIDQALQRLLDQIDDARQRLEPFPFVNTSVLSLSNQDYLRRCPEWEWRTILASLETDLAQQSSDRLTLQIPSAFSLSLSPNQKRAVAELRTYRRSTSSQSLSALLNQIIYIRQRYNQELATISNQSVSEREILQDASMLQWSDAVWQKTQTDIHQITNRILTQGIPPGLPSQLLQDAVNLHVKMQVTQAAQPLATKIVMAVLHPNLKEDPQQTRIQADQAVRAVKPEIVEIRKGQVIVREGESITQMDFVLLDYFGLSRRGINWLGLFGCAGIISGAISIFWLVERRFHPGLRRRDHLAILLLSLSTLLLISLRVPYSNLPAIGLLVGSFYGSALGMTTVGLLTLGLPGLTMGWDCWLAGAVGGLLASLWAARMRSREELAFLGVAVGLTEGIVYLMLNLMIGGSVGPVWFTLLRDAALYSLSGIAWIVIAMGLSPYLEHFFDLVTSIRLAELANPNRPLLKRLAEEAPGTFQHTLFVTSLAEAAAKVLGCNVELVRAGTLYHDIGKLHDPQGFIENQMGKPNKHDEIDDPWQSAAIIKKHVTEGLVMARKHRLPKAIEAFIPEHQGTMLIAYFYHKAQQDGSRPVEEADFRYDGPSPQSRETALLMLADSCEAALRSLKDTTYEEALAMVNKILRARWQDNQLVDSGLTRENMSQIAEIFVQVWQQLNHKRIAYPKGAIAGK